MIYPDNITQSMYKGVFRLSTRSENDGTLAYGRNAEEVKRRMRSSLKSVKSAFPICEQESNQCPIDENRESQDKQFQWEVTGHDKKTLKLKVYFDKPSTISSGVKDEIIVEVTELSVFKTVATGESLTNAAFDGGQPIISKVLPPIIESEELAD